jgi:hypothetical protein
MRAKTPPAEVFFFLPGNGAKKKFLMLAVVLSFHHPVGNPKRKV